VILRFKAAKAHLFAYTNAFISSKIDDAIEALIDPDGAAVATLTLPGWLSMCSLYLFLAAGASACSV
jgi:hypothetical protein